MKLVIGLAFAMFLSAESAHVTQEIPVGEYPPHRPYGTGYVLKTKCPVVPGTIHLTIAGLPYQEGKDFYAGPQDPHKKASGLAPNEIAALDFDFGTRKGKAMPAILVDYDTPDAECAGRK